MESGTRPAIWLSDAVAKEVKVLLVRRDMKQGDLAAKMGVGEMWLSRRLRGAQPIDLNDLQLIAEALDVPAGDLLPRSGEGRTVVVAGEPRESRRSTTVGNHTPTKRARSPRPVGQPQRMVPPDSTRRPVRLSPVTA